MTSSPTLSPLLTGRLEMSSSPTLSPLLTGRLEIRAADSPKRARKLGRRKAKLLRSDWSQVRRVVMTRAIYTRCHTHKELAEALLATGERKLIESSQYDYFWGCGRDRRGENAFGKILMNVRDKLRAELSE